MLKLDFKVDEFCEELAEDKVLYNSSLHSHFFYILGAYLFCR